MFDTTRVPSEGEGTESFGVEFVPHIGSKQKPLVKTCTTRVRFIYLFILVSRVVGCCFDYLVSECGLHNGASGELTNACRKQEFLEC